MRGITTLVAPLSSGPANVTLVGWPRRADPQAVGLRELVVAVGADRQPLHRAGHFVAGGVLGRVERREERAGAGELAAGQVGPDRPRRRGWACRPGWRGSPWPRRRRSGCSCGSRSRRASCAISTTCCAPVASRTLVDLGLQEGHVFRARRAAGLRLRVVVARERVGHVDRMQPVARPAVGFEAPDRGLPDRRRCRRCRGRTRWAAVLHAKGTVAQAASKAVAALAPSRSRRASRDAPAGSHAAMPRHFASRAERKRPPAECRGALRDPGRRQERRLRRRRRPCPASGPRLRPGGAGCRRRSAPAA